MEKARKDNDKLAAKEKAIATSSPVGEDKYSAKWRKPKSGEKGFKHGDKDTKEIKSFAGEQSVPEAGKSFVGTTGSSTLNPSLQHYDGGKEIKELKNKVQKSELIKALADDGHRESALLLKNWDEKDDLCKSYESEMEKAIVSHNDKMHNK